MKIPAAMDVLIIDCDIKNLHIAVRVMSFTLYTRSSRRFIRYTHTHARACTHKIIPEIAFACMRKISARSALLHARLVRAYEKSGTIWNIRFGTKND